MTDSINKTIIVAAYSGTGKTHLYRQFPREIIDLTIFPYKYIVDDKDSNISKEAIKAAHNYEMKFEWPYNYVDAIEKIIQHNKKKIILVPSCIRVIFALKYREIPFILAYPEEQARDIYKERFLKRGNAEPFIEVFIGGWDNFMNTLKHFRHDNKVILKPEEYLSDIPQVQEILKVK